MARKRMISPEIWESQSFGELSMLAKVLFIGMISQADDDGKGVLSAQLLKSKILPFDELRIADIDKALNEIGHNVSVAKSADIDKALNERGHKLSVVFYEVEGRRYYLFENWRKWQTINRPIPSKLPNPPVADGEGEGMHSHEEITNNSVSTHTQLNECSRPIEDIKEENRIPPYPHGEGKGGGEDKLLFFNTYPTLAAFKGRYDDSVIDYSVLLDRFSKSERLRTTYSMKWICDNYIAIKGGLFADKDEKINRTDWERWNFDRRHAAEVKAEKALAYAKTDGIYADIHSKLNELTIELAFTEIKDKPKAAEITKQLKELEAQAEARLKALGIDKTQFSPHYSCAYCSDTGYTKQGFICNDCLKKFKEETRAQSNGN